jgi:eukaryotic-like serine/threonine-protein kinase
MPLIAGARIGPYEVISPLGAGGMGEVYRARDTNLNRDVALKVLPEAFASDADRLARFRREAQLLAALDHPNIAHIHGFEVSSGIPALVIELVEGPTLAERIAAAPRGLPLAEILSLSRQIADALDAAQARGIIHRDLKPANIKVTPGGVVKLLDFGLAKDLVGASGASAMATVADFEPRTRAGSVLGTMAYMSPEQARGEPLDARTDLFSFGALLYEMATGRRAFDAQVSTMVTDAVLHATPVPCRTINSAVPIALERVINRLLEKDRSARYQHASETRADLEQLLQETSGTRVDVVTRPRRRAVAIAATGLAVAGAMVIWMWSRTATGPLTRSRDYVQVTSFADSAVSPSFSRDGRMMTFVQGAGTFYGRGQIYVKALPDGEPVRLTNDAFEKMNPVFSPDGSTIAYTTANPPANWDTWTVSVLGGEPRKWLTNAAALSWVGDKQIMFSEWTSGLHMRLMTSGENREGARPVYDPAHLLGMVHRSHVSPDGRSVLVVEMDSSAWLPCRVVPFDGASAGQRIGPEGQCTDAAWSPDGRWVYMASNAGGAFHLWRQRFPAGAPEQITSGLSEEEGIAAAPDGGSLLTSLGNAQQAIWIRDESGERSVSREGYAFVPSLPSGNAQPFTADGSRLFYLIRHGAVRSAGAQEERLGELWKTDLDSGRSEAVLPGVNMIGYDISRDGTQVTFAALDEGGVAHVWLARLDRQLPPRQLTTLEADTPRFDAAGEIFCRVTEQPSRQNFIYRLKSDASTPEKVSSTPVIFFMSVAPDGSLAVGRTNVSPFTLTLALPTASGSPVQICSTCQVDWLADATALVVRLEGGPRNAGRTLTLGLEKGRMLPRLPVEGLTAESTLPGLEVKSDVPGFLFPGPKPHQYALMRGTIQRNIYRVPLSE